MSAWGVLNHKFKKKERKKDKINQPAEITIKGTSFDLKADVSDMLIYPAQCLILKQSTECSVKYGVSHTNNELNWRKNYSDMAFGLFLCAASCHMADWLFSPASVINTCYKLA